MQWLKKTVQIITHRDIFSDIYGRATEKAILQSALHASKPVNILLNGPPSAGKTQFLRAIEKYYKDQALFLNFTNISKAGALTDIVDKNPKIVLIDEIEKSATDVRAGLLDLMENGRITYKLKDKKIDVQLNTWVIATCNHIDKLRKIQPEFLDRMQVINVKPYEFEEYVKVAVFRLGQEGIGVELAEYIARAVYQLDDEQKIKILCTNRTYGQDTTRRR